MKKKTRNIIGIIVSVIAIIALAFLHIDDNGKITTDFFGWVVLLAGALIIPTVFELMREKKK